MAVALESGFDLRTQWQCVVHACYIVLIAAVGVSAQVLGDPVDVSQDFQQPQNVYFVGARIKDFEPTRGTGTLIWDRYLRSYSLNFNKVDAGLTRGKSTEFPTTEYDQDPALPFSISFITPRTIRLRFNSRDVAFDNEPSLMLVGEPPTDHSWKIERNDKAIIYTSAFGQVRILKDPWHIEIYDQNGKLLTRTQNIGDPHSFLSSAPFSFVRRASDLARRFAATFELSPEEKIFGCGESFTRLNKRGQKINAFTRDAMGVQGQYLYKPIPFFLSSNGYGMFVHTSAPVTFDFGQSFDQHNVIYSADDQLDLFIFLGEPKDVLTEYTALTGRSPVPPLWSFGFWMSRITYKSEDELRDVANKLRQYKIPADVIHLDTGWFETDWRSNYQFSTSRFR
ncbi:MAG TPA: TIM-barrel domain-containing protein, partial [Pyrinomonadaceae bacterium]|nr:TIM-barrel domain-containing protein [Pyrinomonadaceae bacterium]